eukprot:5766004-Lingulodinium_polyedra.AAC.1
MALLSGKDKSQQEKKFPRGVRRIVASNRSDGVPMYALLDVLQDVSNLGKERSWSSKTGRQ